MITNVNARRKPCVYYRRSICIKAGVYIYANPCRDVDLDPALGLTQHTILLAENIIESGENRPSVMQWLWDCVHGRTSKVGLELLG